MKIQSVTIVISVYNEEEALPFFWKKLQHALKEATFNTEIIFVNDGSNDNSKNIINAISKEHNNVTGIHFSRNYGHEAAMLAGIDNAQGDAIICLDADGQHPADKIQDMVSAAENGAQIVNMIRLSRADGGFYKKITSKLFYKILNKISGLHFHENASDFFLITKSVANVLRNEFRERARFLRGIIQIVGFKVATVEFHAPKREQGESKYSLFKLFKFSGNAVVAFSKAPLHLGLILGCIFSVISLLIAIYSFMMWLIDDVPPGYTTLVVLITVMFSILFFLIGIIGVYVGYLFDEIKKRPIYIIDEIITK